MDKIRVVSLPVGLCEAAEKKFGARFGSVEDLLTTLLSELLCDDALKMDAQEQQIIEERLKALGYI
jgi:hypothetical protein